MYLPELSQKELQECLEQPEVLSDYKACAENPSQLSFGFTDELGFCRTDPSFTCSKLDYSEKSSKQKESTYEDENIDPEQSEANIFARLFIEAIIPQGWI